MTAAREAALVVMAQAPVPGRVKTRLQPELSPDECAGIYRAFLLDTLELAVSAGRCIPFLAFSPPDQAGFFAKVAPEQMLLFAQSDGDLGNRMLSVFSQLEDRGNSPIVLIGTDIPTLRRRHIAAAFACLESSDVCLGPSADGGYYLIGARQAHPALFDGIAWSTGVVLGDTLARARQEGLSVTILEEQTDVDTFPDLVWLCDEIERLRRDEEASVPRRTASFLKRLSPILNCGHKRP